MDFNWTLFAQYLILGVTNGALIALIALGYTSSTASSSSSTSPTAKSS